MSDTTVEALAPLLMANPRGLLLARDELAGWLGSFDRYSGGKGGADAAHWLSMYDGESIVVDRKTGVPRTIYVPQASVSVTGGIQPTILHRALGTEHRESGLAARLLLTCPPRKAGYWTEDDIAPEAQAELAGIVSRLCELAPTIDNDNRPRAVVVGLTPEAKRAWVGYVNSHAEEHLELSGDLAAAWAKLKEVPARLALALVELVQAGIGSWRDAPPGPKGGRPSRVFSLSTGGQPTVSTSTQPHDTRDSWGFVDVDSVDTPKTQPEPAPDSDEWGEL